MASHAFVDQILYVEPFTSGANDFTRITFNVWFSDASGARSKRTAISVDVLDSDAVSTVQTKISTAVNAQATALGFTVPASATLLIAFVRV